MRDVVRLGIIGYGTQGSMYARLIDEGLVPSLAVAAIADPDEATRDRASAEFPSAQVFTDHISMLDSGAVDAVVTCVPHYLHPAYAMAALERGIHVLVEKPAGVFTRQVAELNAFAAEHPHVTFGIMFNQRNNPLYRRLREILAAGEIGSVLRTNWVITTWWRPQGYYDSSAWRATWGSEGGGVLVNQAPHQLDLWQWLCGAPQKVFAKVAYGFQRDIVVEDEVNALVDFGEGVTGTFTTSTHDLRGTDRLEIVGERGKIVVEGSRVAEVTRYERLEREISASIDSDAVKRVFSGELDPSQFYTTERLEFTSRWGEQHAGVLENFARNILDGTPLIAPGADGIDGVRLANAIHLSSWLGVEVDMDFDEETYLSELEKRVHAEGGDATLATAAIEGVRK
ncbi:Gfo/Idh/MocA family protein [Microbacterium xanthum]|uniref:Gfo/Idh/MocA family protein n=1 Tax=Microbacterium xanthum TaxID=3079794 RepID=UPI002AD34E5E|nr:Gfo/Idh/MocA family oxidoreductase [Microbacterium sp. KSW-48]MDZ8171156.1 Gfo/Idh/MocA family oxidoreductase [Microbacterium sp. KSW-48]